MIKAGILGAVAGFIYVMSLSLMSPFCTLCFTPLLGLTVGYLAGQFDKPTRPDTSLTRGSIAGGICGVAAILGQVLASVVNGILVTHLEEMPVLMQELGLTEFFIRDSREYWQMTMTTTALCGLANLLIIAGLGALGSLIWFRRQRRHLLSTISS